MIKKFINSSLNKLGYEIKSKKKILINNSIPVEFNRAELEIINYIMSNKLTMASCERLYATVMACKYVLDNDIQGDFVECGVWRGGNALAAAEIFKIYGSDKKVWLFDTFQGMTAPADVDIGALSGESAKFKYEANQNKTHNTWCYASLDEVRNNFAKRKVTSNVFFIQGNVNQTLTSDITERLNKISILRLDTDFYESTKNEIEVLYPKLSIGGVLIIDDYGHWQGSRKAIDEYFKQNPKKPFLQYIDYTGRMGVKNS